MTKLMTPNEHTDIYKIISETVTRSDTQLASEEVRKGALILDQKHPGWFNKINLDSFDITSSSQCVFGQLYGEYEDNNIKKIFRLRRKQGESDYELENRRETISIKHGFNAGEGGSHDFKELQENWIKAIKTRQETYTLATKT